MVETGRVVQIPKRKESWVVHACNQLVMTQEAEAGGCDELKTYLGYRARLSKIQERVSDERGIYSPFLLSIHRRRLLSVGSPFFSIQKSS